MPLDEGPPPAAGAAGGDDVGRWRAGGASEALIAEMLTLRRAAGTPRPGARSLAASPGLPDEELAALHPVAGRTSERVASPRVGSWRAPLAASPRMVSRGDSALALRPDEATLVLDLWVFAPESLAPTVEVEEDSSAWLGVITALGGAAFLDDMRQLAGRDLAVASVDPVQLLSADLATVGEELDVCAAELGSQVGRYEWTAVREEWEEAPADEHQARARVATTVTILTNLRRRRAAAAPGTLSAAGAAGRSAVLTSARVDAISEALEKLTSASSDAAKASAVAVEVAEPITELTALERVAALASSGGLSAESACALRALIADPELGQAAEALIFSSFKAPGALKPVPRVLAAKRRSLASEAVALARAECASGTPEGTREREGHLAVADVQGIVDDAWLLKVDSQRIVRRFGGDPAVQRGISTNTVAAVVAERRPGDPAQRHDVVRAFTIFEKVLWLLWGEAGGLPPAKPGGSDFGLVTAIQSLFAMGLGAARVLLAVEYVAGSCALDMWERRTLPGSPRPDIAAELSRLQMTSSLQTLQIEQLVQTLVAQAAAGGGAQTLLSPGVMAAGAPAASTAGTPAPGATAGQHSKRAITGATGYLKRHRGMDAAQAAKHLAASSVAQVKELAALGTAAAKAAKLAKQGQPPAAQQQQQQQPPPQQQQQQQQQQYYQQGYAQPHQYLPPPLPQPGHHTPWQPPPGWPPAPWTQGGPQAGGAQVGGAQAGGGGAPSPGRVQEDAAMVCVAALLVAGAAGSLTSDKDCVRAFDVLIRQQSIQPAPCAWRALFTAGHVNCSGRHKCKCTFQGAKPFDETVERPVVDAVRALADAAMQQRIVR